LVHQGLIEFKNMTLYYDVNMAPALKNLNLTIEPGMKVGIVGRFVSIISFCEFEFFDVLFPV
jgi:ABC-type transport system involved in cytochrome bd biosynthesis fused ATPase/permease subunit